jgi:hypothetical protein
MHHRFSHEITRSDAEIIRSRLEVIGSQLKAGRQGTSWNNLKIWWISKGKDEIYGFFCVSRDFLDIVYLQVAFDRFFLLHVPTDSIVFGFRKRIWFQGYRFYSQWIIFTCVDICIHPLYGCPVVYTYLDYTSTVSHSYVFFCQKMSKIALLMEKNDHWNWGCPSAPPLFGR